MMLRISSSFLSSKSSEDRNFALFIDLLTMYLKNSLVFSSLASKFNSLNLTLISNEEESLDLNKQMQDWQSFSFSKNVTRLFLKREPSTKSSSIK